VTSDKIDSKTSGKKSTRKSKETIASGFDTGEGSDCTTSYASMISEQWIGMDLEQKSRGLI
jgi:hypothetical protein